MKRMMKPLVYFTGTARIRQYAFGFALSMISLLISSCTLISENKSLRKSTPGPVEQIRSNINGSGQELEITFIKGKEHNHPTFAIWLEDTAGNYLQTLFVTRAIGQGVFTYGDKSDGKWKSGEVRRPAAIPYWSHKRGVKAPDGLYIPSPDNPVPDAYSGATPKGDFMLRTHTDTALAQKVNVLLEINQPWDWNEYWTNSKYPDDKEYETSCQPSLVYSATLDLHESDVETPLVPVGHGHYSGRDGSLTNDLSTITTALKILESVKVKLIQKNN